MVRPPNPPPPPTVNADHPYYLSAGDNRGLLLVPAVLSGAADYYSWARSMRMALMSKNKLGFIDPLHQAWCRANVLVLGWLHKALSPDIAQSIL
ncbi:hypothetical protein LINGRAPRIM_LOCUS699 [Linum grandiflorum]